MTSTKQSKPIKLENSLLSKIKLNKQDNSDKSIDDLDDIFDNFEKDKPKKQEIEVKQKNKDKDENKDEAVDEDKKKCRKCNTIKLKTCFSKHSGTADGLDNRCKECVKAVKTKIKEQNKEEDANFNPRKYIQEATDYLDNFTPDETHENWQGGKVKGTIFNRKDDKKFTASFNGKQKNLILTKRHKLTFIVNVKKREK